MNINQIKLFTWLVSASVTAGVGYYVYEFRIRAQTWRTEHRISSDEAARILEDAKIPEGPKASLVDRHAVERSFYYDLSNRNLPNLLDWSGTPPREVVDTGPEIVEELDEPEFKSIIPLIHVVSIFEDLDSPDRGIAIIQYSEDSGVKSRSDGFPFEIHVDDKLRKPLDYVTVKAIRAEEVVFTFDDGVREDESVSWHEFDPETQIHVVTGATPEIKRPLDSVPRVDIDTWRPQHTTKIDEDHYRLGVEDSLDFAEDFGGIIAREVRHGRHFNRKTGKYDGIELKEVKSGGKVAGHGGQSGDIIKSINGHPVTSPAEAISYVKNNKDKFSKWIVVVENKGQERTLTFESPPE